MEERDLTEMEIRYMLDRALDVKPGRVDGRFEVSTKHRGHPWIVVLEPDSEDSVTAFREDLP